MFVQIRLGWKMILKKRLSHNSFFRWKSWMAVTAKEGCDKMTISLYFRLRRGEKVFCDKSSVEGWLGRRWSWWDGRPASHPSPHHPPGCPTRHRWNQLTISPSLNFPLCHSRLPALLCIHSHSSRAEPNVESDREATLVQNRAYTPPALGDRQSDRVDVVL